MIVCVSATLAGCGLLPGEQGPIGPPGMQGRQGEPGGNDGLRLVRRMFIGGDGSAGVLGWRDTKLGHVCEFIEVQDGTEAVCAPPGVQTTSMYGDDACTVPIVATESADPLGWWTDARALGVYQPAQDMFAGMSAWTWVDGACVPAPPCGMAECIALLPASSLITVELEN
jgi:hypothetical protein